MLALHAMTESEWERLREEDWPQWVIEAAYPEGRSDELRRAWEGKMPLFLTDRTYRYQVIPAPGSWGHGNMEIGSIKRQKR